MHFQVEKANEFRSFLFFAPSFLLRSTYLLPLRKRTTSPLFLNIPPSSSFSYPCLFFLPLFILERIGTRGRLLGCSSNVISPPLPSRAREAIIGSQMHSRRVPSAPLIKSLMRLPIEGGRSKAADKNAADLSRVESSRVESREILYPFRWVKRGEKEDLLAG